MRILIKGLVIYNDRFSKKLIEYWPVSGTLSITVMNHKIKFFSKADDALTSKLYYGVKWEENEIRIFSLLADHVKIIFDIGGNIGLYSLAAAKTNSEVKIYCFEPNPKNVARLKKNISLNKLKSQIHVIDKGVGAAHGTIPFYLPDNDLISDVSSMYKSHTQSFSDFNIEQISVELISVDEFILDYKVNPDLIKIDAELFEFEVLKGMHDFLVRSSPIIICEVFNDLVKTNRNVSLKEELPRGYTKSIENYLIDLGFYFFQISGKGLLLVENLRSNPDSSMYLFLKRKLKRIFYPIEEISDFVKEIYT